MDIHRFKEMVQNKIDEISEDLFDISDYIFNNPEYCFKEYLAADKLSEYLENSGFTVERGMADLETAFKAVYDSGKDGYHIGIMAEYDAVPGMGHSCGHNLMAAMAAGAGVAVKSAIDETGGKISVFGTPAEEGGGGKILMLEKGVFNDLDAAMILHPANETVVNDISYSMTDVEVNFYGKTAHAATFPEEGISALNAVIELFNVINAMRLELGSEGKILGVITKGGENPIYIPDHCQARFTVRSFNMKTKKALVNRLLETCEYISKITGTRFEYDFYRLSYEDIRNNHTIENLLEKNLVSLGETVMPRKKELGIGCTDMGNITHHLPALQSYIKVAPGLRGHTIEFEEACGDDRGRKALITGAKAMAMTAIDLMSDANMSSAKNDFKAMIKSYE